MPESDDLNDSLSNNSNSFVSVESHSAIDDTSDERDIFTFSSKGLHLCNLNVRHILLKIDEIRLLLSNNNSPDIFGICESFLGTHHPDSLISINGYTFIRKDRSETQDKCGGGLVLFARQSLNVKRRQDLEISNIETIWAEVSLPNSKPFLVCTAYRPPSASSEWTDLFEKESSIAQTTGLEFLLMGDFNIDMISCSNSKWLNLIQLFDRSQLVKHSTRVTETSSSIIDHAYATDLGNITECFVPSYAISDHFPICFTRKVHCKIPKTEHITTSYRCFKTFDEQHFLADLHHDLCNFETNRETIDEDFTALHAIIMNHLDKHDMLLLKFEESNQVVFPTGILLKSDRHE